MNEDNVNSDSPEYSTSHLRVTRKSERESVHNKNEQNQITHSACNTKKREKRIWMEDMTVVVDGTRGARHIACNALHNRQINNNVNKKGGILNKNNKKQIVESNSEKNRKRDKRILTKRREETKVRCDQMNAATVEAGQN